MGKDDNNDEVMAILTHMKKHMATKEDLERFATKEDLDNLASKADLARVEQKVDGIVNRLDSDLDKRKALEVRVDRLEKARG